MTGWQVRTELSHTKKDCPALVSQWKLNLLINSLDNFNASSKSKPYTFHKHIVINFDSTRWRCLISAYYTVRLDRELVVQFMYFSDFVMTGWYHETQHTSSCCYTTFLILSWRAPALTDYFKGFGKDSLSNIHYRFFLQSLHLHHSLASHSVPKTTPKVKKDALTVFF